MDARGGILHPYALPHPVPQSGTPALASLRGKLDSLLDLNCCNGVATLWPDNQHCYNRLNDTLLTFDEAERACNALDAHLINVMDADYGGEAKHVLGLVNTF